MPYKDVVIQKALPVYERRPDSLFLMRDSERLIPIGTEIEVDSQAEKLYLVGVRQEALPVRLKQEPDKPLYILETHFRKDYIRRLLDGEEISVEEIESTDDLEALEVLELLVGEGDGAYDALTERGKAIYDALKQDSAFREY